MVPFVTVSTDPKVQLLEPHGARGELPRKTFQGGVDTFIVSNDVIIFE